MGLFIASLAVGLGVGIVYGLLGVKSPAPPMIALVGLVGMLAGEAAVSFVKGHPNVWATMFHSKTFDIGESNKPHDR